MQKKGDIPEPGDIIRSHIFDRGYYEENGRIWVGNGFGSAVPALSDESRARARYVVEERRYIPEDDGCADCNAVYARRLREDGSYDPEGEAIAFHMRSDYRQAYVDDELEIVGKMRRTVTVTYEKLE